MMYNSILADRAPYDDYVWIPLFEHTPFIFWIPSGDMLPQQHPLLNTEIAVNQDVTGDSCFMMILKTHSNADITLYKGPCVNEYNRRTLCMWY